MKKLSIVFIVFLFAIKGISQTHEHNTSSKFNLDFEIAHKDFAKGWNNFGGSNYKISLDSTYLKKGNYSASIELKEGAPDFKALAFKLPDNYDGQKITLSGFIKTENVSEGHAGLWMRIDPQIVFDNMTSNGIKGTTDWTKYEITLDMNPKKTKKIVVGGLLVGKGKMWIDDLKISIDGKDIKTLKPFERELLPADKDKEFDNGSNITITSLNNNQIQNLKALGLIWGFLKYYHPDIAAGKYNWDYELFRILPKIINSKNKKNRDDILIRWVNNLGSFSKGKTLKTEDLEVKIKPDLKWIDTSNLSKELSSLLHKVKNSERTDEHYYVGLYPNVQNPEFKNEKAYKKMEYPDAGFRILTLFKYWNIIQYYFPYKDLIEEDWKNILEEFIPKMIEAKNKTDYTLTTLELIERISDTHANIWGRNKILFNYFGEKYSALELDIIEDKAVVVGYFDDELGKETGLKIGDVISKVNNNTIKKIVKNNLKHAPASNYPTKLRDIAPKILRTNDSLFNIEYIRNSQKKRTILKAYSTKEVNIYKKYQVKDTCFKYINKDISYVNNGALKKAYLPKLWEEIKQTKGLIIDIRNYPTDFPIYAFSNYLMPKSLPFVKFSKGSIQNPGLFTIGEPISVGKENKDYYKGKVVILINETSQSSAEFHAMAYRTHPNATVIGSTTAGADGNISRFSLPGGISTMITGIGVFYPDGTGTQRIGIVPDIEFKPTLNGIKEGRDELLEKAIEIINE